MKKSPGKQTTDSASEHGSQATRHTARPHPMEARIHWLHAKKTPFRAGVAIAAIILAAPLLLQASFPPGNDPGAECTRFSINVVMWSFSALMLLLVIPLLVFVHRLVNTRLGFRDEWVLVARANGPVHIARDEDLIRVNQGFIIEGVTVPTGNPKMPLYKAEDLDEWLAPRLARGSQLGPIEQLTWQWRNRRGLFVVVCASVVAGLALVIALESGWMEEAFKGWLESQPECEGLLEERGESDG